MVKKYAWMCGAAAVLCLAGILLFWNLGGLPFEDYDEATYADVALHVTEGISEPRYSFFRWGFGTDNQIVARPWFEKPPLVLWLMAGSMSLFGASEGAARLPSASFAFGVVALTMLFGWRVTGKKSVGILGAFVLLLNPYFIAWSREARLDAPVLFFILAAMICARQWQTDKRVGWMMGFWAALAGGFLSKSVIGLIPLGLVPVALAWSKGSDVRAWFRTPQHVIGILIFLVLFLPWHVLEWRAHGTTFLTTYFLSHSLSRLNENVLGGDDKGFFFYARYFWTHLRLWFGVVGTIIVLAVGTVCALRGIGAKVMWRHPVVGWFVVPAVLVGGVFSLAQTKLFPYIMPLFPFAALAASAGLVAVFRLLQTSPMKIKTVATAAVGMLCLFGFVVAGNDAVQYGWKWERRDGNLFDLSADAIYADERTVGKLIGSQNLPAYMYLWSQVESITFYAQRPVHFLPNMSEVVLPPPALLVLPSMLSSSADFPAQDTLYRGPLFTVVRIPK